MTALWRWGDLAYEAHGQGRPVVFLHGFAGSRQQWRPYVQPLTRRGFRVYLVDLPAHGRSPAPLSLEGYRPEVWVDALHQWHRTHVDGPSWWVAHSLGGGMTVALARQYADLVKGGVLVAPYLHREQWTWWLHLLKPLVKSLWRLHRYPRWLAPLFYQLWRWHPEYRGLSERVKREWIWEMVAYSPKAWRVIATMTQPLLPRPPGRWAVVAGRRDPILRYETFEKLSQAWGVPLYTIPRGWHMVHVHHTDRVLHALFQVMRA